MRVFISITSKNGCPFPREKKVHTINVLCSWELKWMIYFWLLQVPPELESKTPTACQDISESFASREFGERKKISRKKSIAKGLLLVGGIICLSRGHASLGAKVMMACIVKKLATKNGSVSSRVEQMKQITSQSTLEKWTWRARWWYQLMTLLPLCMCVILAAACLLYVTDHVSPLVPYHKRKMMLNVILPCCYRPYIFIDCTARYHQLGVGQVW